MKKIPNWLHFSLILLTFIKPDSIYSQSDDPCSATSLTINTSCSYGSYTTTGATASAGVPAPGCASYNGGDVWFSITVPANGEIYVNSNTGGITDGGMAVYSGACGALTLVECDDDDSPNGLMPYVYLTGQTPGNTLWIRFWAFNNNETGTFDICAHSPVPPANDDPCSATSLAVGAGCSYTTSTNANATPSAGVPAPGCASYSGGDVWFSFTVPATGAVEINSNTGVITDGGMAVYSGACGALTLISCDDDSSPNGAMPYILLNGQTPGNTIWIRFWEYGNDDPGTFDICVSEYTPPPPPANDECTGAINIPVSVATCSTVSGTIEGATGSSQTNGCGGTADDDVWYSFVPTTAAVDLTLSNVTGSTTDLYHSVYSGTCGSIGAEIICSDPNSSALTGLTIGNTYYIRIFSYTSSYGQDTDFDICVQAVSPCGTYYNQDYCVAPAILSEGPGDFSANTSDTYSSDQPANLFSLFCGSVENNSWYSFVATGTSHDFDVVDVSGASCSDGIQGEVYSVTEDADGCCTNFTSMSNCWNPAIATTGTISAIGLTIGNEYVLMIDGFAGDVCDFTISGWTAEGILLSIDLIHFDVMMDENYNKIYWTTSSERDNDYFIIERSFDGHHFEFVGKISGAGNSTDILNYSINDYNIRSGMVYYRLKQVNYDGSTDKSKVVSVSRTSEDLFNAYPNPATDLLTIEVAASSSKDNRIEIISIDGVVIEEISLNNSGFQTIEIPVKDLANGIYFIRHQHPINGIKQIQFIKK